MSTNLFWLQNAFKLRLYRVILNSIPYLELSQLNEYDNIVQFIPSITQNNQNLVVNLMKGLTWFHVKHTSKELTI